MWTYIKPNMGMGLEGQHFLRWQNAPVAVLKLSPKQDEKDRWSLSLLKRDGISASTTIVLAPLELAKEYAERMAREEGWDNAKEAEASVGAGQAAASDGERKRGRPRMYNSSAEADGS